QPGALYTLTTPNNQTFGPNGLPAITTTFTIQGNGATIQRSGDAGTPAFRLLWVDTSGNLNLDGVTLRNGQARFGGAIGVDGTLVLTSSVLDGNSAPSGFGGGLFSDGTTTLQR